MCVEQEIGKCSICKKEGVALNRKYYSYDIKCECHSPSHFEVVPYCDDCTPVEPKETRIILSTGKLRILSNTTKS